MCCICIVCIHRDRNRIPWTKELDDSDPLYTIGLRSWGPYRTQYRGIPEMMRIYPLCLVGTGAGAAYIIDFYHWLITKVEENDDFKVVCLYCCYYYFFYFFLFFIFLFFIFFLSVVVM